MANAELLISTVLKDLNGNSTPQQAYADAADTVTLAQLITAVQAYQALLDPVTDALLVKVSVSVNVPLAGGLKGTAGPNPIIAGALFTYPKTGQENRSWGQVTPAWAQAKIASGAVDLTDTAVQNYYKNWAQNNITNLTSFLSNNWEGLQPAKRVKLNDRSHEREYNRNSTRVSIP